MAKFGYKLMTETHGPKELLRNTRLAEETPASISFRFPIISIPGSSRTVILLLRGACSVRSQRIPNA